MESGGASDNVDELGVARLTCEKRWIASANSFSRWLSIGEIEKYAEAIKI